MKSHYTTLTFFALLTLMVLLPANAAASSGVIQFHGLIYTPASAARSFAQTSYSANEVPPHVDTQELRASRARMSLDLLDYFAGYASPTASVVTARYN
ncbi:hypothetical protein SAMN05216570_2746 [Dyella sp. OK004]|uniref:hypothetical protein n=1 Tax=Dyella sp. OK004 TaxID=1855292 RepID=UPI0008E7C760|nr:hypothetical protein [Dyella sp. OK004]SFS12818.1 hypothetical protein SAMN05216570_2746 [Dyella sp. OK004]